MPDYEKIGREVRSIFTAFPVEPETEEGKMVADLRYPGWREKRIVNVDTDNTPSSEIARALGFSGEMVSYTFEGGTPCPSVPVSILPSAPTGPMTLVFGTHPVDGQIARVLPPFDGDVPPLVPTPEAVEKWGEWWWYEGDIVEVFECSGATPGWGRLLATRSGDEREYYVNGMDGEWAGPVLERPVKREG